jgi:uracil-DNA glycosylase
MILDLNITNLKSYIVEDWYRFILEEIHNPYFQTLLEFINTEYSTKTIYPPQPQIFNAFNFCPLDKIRVVILGQDPYHGENQAHGLAFSVAHNKLPPSLRNIMKEVADDIGDGNGNNGTNASSGNASSGNLEHWAKQGVLLLNNVLTVRNGIAHSHKNRGWEEFTSAVIQKLNNDRNRLVFILWGRPAQKKGMIIDDKRHLVIKSSHPSPLGYTKTNQPFKGSKCFSRTNRYLNNYGKKPIDWLLG